MVLANIWYLPWQQIFRRTCNRCARRHNTFCAGSPLLECAHLLYCRSVLCPKKFPNPPQDTLFAAPIARPGDWTFDEKVADVFPGYDQTLNSGYSNIMP